MNARSRGWSLTASALVLGVALSGCGNSSDGSAGSGSTAGGGYSATMPASPSAPATTVAVGSTDLGDVLVDGAGMTLYLFTNDTQGAGTSTCEGDCLAAWPALTGIPSAGTGVDAAELGTITRSDGSTQATYNGWPLYYWASDAKPGDTTGQGVNGIWFVLDAQGNAVR